VAKLVALLASLAGTLKSALDWLHRFGRRGVIVSSGTARKTCTSCPSS
jgi:hypothetical protein